MIKHFLKPRELANGIGAMMDEFHDEKLTRKAKVSLVEEIYKSVEVLYNAVGVEEGNYMISDSDHFPINKRNFWNETLSEIEKLWRID